MRLSLSYVFTGLAAAVAVFKEIRFRNDFGVFSKDFPAREANVRPIGVIVLHIGGAGQMLEKLASIIELNCSSVYSI